MYDCSGYLNMTEYYIQWIFTMENLKVYFFKKERGRLEVGKGLWGEWSGKWWRTQAESWNNQKTLYKYNMFMCKITRWINLSKIKIK